MRCVTFFEACIRCVLHDLCPWHYFWLRQRTFPDSHFVIVRFLFQPVIATCCLDLLLGKRHLDTLCPAHGMPSLLRFGKISLTMAGYLLLRHWSGCNSCLFAML